MKKLVISNKIIKNNIILYSKLSLNLTDTECLVIFKMGNTLDRKFFCWLFVSLLLKEAASEGWGKFHESPGDMTVGVGQDVTLTCRVWHNDLHPPVSWTFKAEALPDAPAVLIGSRTWPYKGTIIYPRFNRFSWATEDDIALIDRNYGIYDLIIKKTTISDTGNYTCVRRKIKTRTAHLKVTRLFNSTGLPEIKARPGDTVRLPCTITEPHRSSMVYWRIKRQDSVVISLYRRSDLYPGGPTRYSRRITYDWNLKQTTLYDLIISDVQRSDRGSYWCLVAGKVYQNWVGTLNLAVLYDGDPVLTRRPQDTYALVDENVHLRCGANTRKSGHVKARWYKWKNKARGDYKRITNYKHLDREPNERYKWVSSSSGNFDIILLSVKRSDGGYYWCKAEPDPKVDRFDVYVEAGATLTVVSKPSGSTGSFIPTSEKRSSIEIVAGNTVRLPCIPKHKIIWLDEDLNILTVGTKRVTDDQRIGTPTIPEYSEWLEIKNVQIEDAKKYYCVLVGDKDVWEKVVQLVVIGCPGGPGHGFWYYNDDAKTCFGTSTIQETFGAATRWCRQHNAELAMPRTPEEVRMLQESSTGVHSYPIAMWVGMDDIEWEGLWKYADDRFVGQINWKENEPDNKNYEDCGLIDNNDKFRDWNCGHVHRFLCQYPAVHRSSQRVKEKHRCPDGWIFFDCGGFCYWKSNDKLTWQEALEACEDKSASLVKISSRRQWRAVQLMLDDNWPNLIQQEAWIGLKKLENYLIWPDGTLRQDFSFPHGVNQRSGSCISLDSKGELHTNSCSKDKKYYVCHQPQHSLSKSKETPPVCGESSVTNSHSRFKRHVSKASGPKTNKTNDRLSLAAISDGELISIQNAPWLVRVFSQAGNKYKSFVCNGVLIGPKTVLTSARCMQHKYDVNKISHNVFVGLGTEDKEFHAGRTEPVHMVYIHRDFSGNMLSPLHDIALIELKRKQTVDCWNVKPACLPQSRTVNLKGHICIAYSWVIGRLKYCLTDSEQFSLRQSSGTLFYSHVNPCRFGDWDKGAPMLCMDTEARHKKWTLIGIYSGSVGRYQEFTFVPNYLTWIQDNMQDDDPDTKLYHETTCHHESLDIACDHGRPPHLWVHLATYGASSTSRCVWQTPKDPGCSSDVTDEVRQRCAGTNRCQFNVTTELFGDPCPGHYEYLDLIYKCIPSRGLYDFQSKVFNEYQDLELSCGEGNPLMIKLQYAFYRKATETGKCPKRYIHGKYCPFHRESNSPCVAKNVTTEIAARCNGKVYCRLPGTVYFITWGDPCVGRPKQLEVKYNCLQRHFSYDEKMCRPEHGQVLELECWAADVFVIRLLVATYGRAYNSDCSGDWLGDSGCVLKDVTSDIAARCEGKVACAYPVPVDVWGDPCPGKTKQLKVTYNCVKKSQEDVKTEYAKAAGETTQPSAILFVASIAINQLLYI